MTRRRLATIALAFLALLVAAAGSGYLWLRTSLPVTDGTIALSGLQSSVQVTRDRYGVPTIVAASEHDADFALGFVHAQDRLFSMDMMRRYGAGRLSEIFGARTLPIDRTMRVLGLYRAAEAQYAILAPEVRADLDAYAAGVNAYLATRTGALPPEYLLLGARPEPWRAVDSLVWEKIMDLELTANLRGELMRARLLTRLTPDDLAVLYPSYPKDGPVTLEGARAMLRKLPLDALYGALPADIGPQAASNNWVVDGAHSQSGKPLLANDPHLDFSAPGVWYLARIETPQGTIAGVTAPGNPFVIIGHNDRIAWGFTTTGGDVEDLFVEKPDPADPGRYLTPDGSLPFIVRQERIAVRGAPDEVLDVRGTRHGPVISDLAGYKVGDDVLALSATWLGADDATPQAILDMGHARDGQQFVAALRNWVAPQQNIVYADGDGTIGFIAPARIPIRKSGDARLPAPGWTGESDWIGWVPFDALPHAVNPTSGRFVTANNKIVPDDYPYLITRDWGPPFRAERIAELLDATPKQTPSSSGAIQLDDLSLAAKTLLPMMLDGTARGGTTGPWLDLLRRWNDRMDGFRVEPLIYVAWLRELTRELLSTRLGPMFPAYWSLRPDVIELILTKRQDWCGGKCGQVLATSLGTALADLGRRYGSDPRGWRWGSAHEAAFTSQVWSNVPVIGRWFDLSVPADGSDGTVNAGGMYIGDEAAPFLDRHGPSLRMVVDLAAPAAARFVIAPGQSGNPLSRHWGDLVPAWRTGRSITFGDDASGGTLTLAPKGGS
jgi:penicillin G amidase